MTETGITNSRRTEQLMQKFLGSPAGKAAQAAADAEIADERKYLVLQWQKADAAALAGQQAFEAHRLAEVERLAAMEMALSERRAALAAKLSANISIMYQLSIEKQRCERALEESASPAIQEFIEQLSSTLEILRRDGLKTTLTEQQSRLFGAPAKIVWTNIEALQSALARIINAQAAARELLLLPDQTKIEEQIEMLRKHVGDLTNLEMVERVIERPVFVKESKS